VSEYIPTTEEVRQGFADNSFTFMSHEGVTIQVATKWFDHWLAQHDAEIEKATEKRIIKLLEDKGWGNKYMVALIKGDATSKDSFTVGLDGESQKDNETISLLTEGENK
jgi:hypothetical protein